MAAIAIDHEPIELKPHESDVILLAGRRPPAGRNEKGETALAIPPFLSVFFCLLSSYLFSGSLVWTSRGGALNPNNRTCTKIANVP
jgi:hypothetical protein